MQTLLQEAVGTETRVVPLTVEQYHRMLETGILEEGEPIELLDGLLVVKDRGDGMTVSPPHALAVSRLIELAAAIAEAGGHLRIQSPMTIAPRHEPEPDGLIVRGGPERYADRHPAPEDVSCAIEVSETSLVRDRTLKQRIYAAAGVPQYLIVNLVDRRVEVYRDPDLVDGRYRDRAIRRDDDSVELLLPDHDRPLVVPASRLLP